MGDVESVCACVRVCVCVCVCIWSLFYSPVCVYVVCYCVLIYVCVCLECLNACLHFFSGVTSRTVHTVLYVKLFGSSFVSPFQCYCQVL